MRNRKTIHFFILLALTSLSCFSQNNVIDSVRHVAATSTDTAKLHALTWLCEAYTYKNSDSTIKYATLACDESAKLNYPMGRPLFRLGIAHFHKGNYREAEHFLRRAIAVEEKNNNAPMLAGLYSYLGQALMNQGDFRQAINMLKRSSAYSDTYNDIAGNSIQTAHLSQAYRSLGDYTQAFTYSQETIDLVEKLQDTIRLMICANLITGSLYKDAGEYVKAAGYFYRTVQNAYELQIPTIAYKLLGQTYSLMKKYDSSLYFYQRLVKSREYIEDLSIKKIELLKDSIDICEAFIGQQRYDEALPFLAGALTIFLQKNARPEVTQVLLDLARVYRGKNDPQHALQYAYMGLAMARETEARPFIRDGYELLSAIYDRENKTDSAYVYYRRFVAMEKTVIDDQFKQILALKDIKEAEEKNLARISSLSREKKKQFNLFIAAVSVGLILAFFIIRSMILKRRKEQLQHLVAEANAQLEQKRRSQQLSELQKKATELEMQALRSQMSPHFIFNSLNSINRFILQNNKAQASEYLTKFSKLVRLILQNSQSAFIPLESELESLQLYLELEAVRFDHHFEFVISVENDLDTSVLKVPPLIIQPFAENAIWHGLMHKDEKGRLGIELFLRSDVLFCLITDDGVGRRKAAELKSKSTATHKSMGMQITASRIEMLQQNNNTDTIKITDLVLPDGSPGGTEVLMKIPVRYD
ncbi:MAG: tetratricopeptide repeat protein [Chitinophagaceae bacterium]|nr:tetratricopeptide repeat protein [Chitinophagaceae bacterium]